MRHIPAQTSLGGRLLLALYGMEGAILPRNAIRSRCRMFDAADRASPTELKTIGYEGEAIEAFLQKLRHHGVRIVIDVRELPLSRKRGFSKRSFEQHLQAEGIRYVHVRDLGDPKPGRLAARAGDHELFVQIFSEHMAGDAAKAAVTNILPMIAEGGACLLCFERCHSGCHRSIVADVIAEKMHVSIRHVV